MVLVFGWATPAVELLALLLGAELPEVELAAAPLPVVARAPGASPIARWALAAARKSSFTKTFTF